MLWYLKRDNAENEIKHSDCSVKTVLKCFRVLVMWLSLLCMLDAATFANPFALNVPYATLVYLLL